MKVKELTPEEMQELKIRYLLIEKGIDLTAKDAMNIDNIVKDKEIFEAYKEIDFVKADFLCNSQAHSNFMSQKPDRATFEVLTFYYDDCLNRFYRQYNANLEATKDYIRQHPGADPAQIAEALAIQFKKIYEKTTQEIKKEIDGMRKEGGFDQ